MAVTAPVEMTAEEYAACAEEHGATYACWEAAARWLKVWRHNHPDDDRDDIEILTGDDFGNNERNS